ncbi:hypothetical protein BZA77DRAFT_306621 [Pyronema omphalodes]|nr:hypothetical protein BZA77DRAFT_306621 [Pyronema omphalodes]
MDRLSRRLRGNALKRLAVISSREDLDESAPESAFDQLTASCIQQREASPETSDEDSVPPANPDGTSLVPMSIRELEVLLALCQAAPSLRTHKSAEKLARQLHPYMIESPTQRFQASPYLRVIEPSPWEALATNITTALLHIGINFPDLREEVNGSLYSYLRRVQTVSEETEDEVEIACIAVSVVGFLESAAKVANFWTPEEREQLVVVVCEILSEQFMGKVDAAFQTMKSTQKKQARQWIRYVGYYESIGRPLGALLIHHALQKLLVTGTSLIVTNSTALYDGEISDLLMKGRGVVSSIAPEEHVATVESYVQLIASSIAMADEANSSTISGAEVKHSLAHSVKSEALTAYCNCVILSNVADASQLLQWLESTIADPNQMSNVVLAKATLKTLAILSRVSRDDAGSDSLIIGMLQRFIIEGSPCQEVVKIAAKCLSYVLQYSTEDAMITTLNTMGHILSSQKPETALQAGALQPFEQQQTPAISPSLGANPEESRYNIYCNVIDTIVGIATNCTELKTISLCITILIQRIGKVKSQVHAKILSALALMVPVSTAADCKAIVEVFDRTTTDGIRLEDHALLEAALAARISLAQLFSKESQHHDLFLTDMLTALAEIGSDPKKKQVDAVLAAREIEQYIAPIAILLAKNGTDVNFALRSGYSEHLRNFWINCVLHGIYFGSELAKKNAYYLRTIARYTPPLVVGNTAEDKTFDSNLDEKSLLRRYNSPANLIEHKRRLTNFLPAEEINVRALTYERAVFLEAVFSLECMRAEGGGCSKVLAYFVEPAFKAGEAAALMTAISVKVTDIYVALILTGSYPNFTASRVADQLADVFVGCCHRLEKVQASATNMADRIINTAPSALCRRSSLFALLELLTLMWTSCLKEETDEYATKSIFTSERGRVAIEMPDSYKFRQQTLRNFQAKSKTWVLKVLNQAPFDLKGLLQTYLSEFEDQGTLGHVSLGRTFALEMGQTVPNSDRRLASIDFLKESGGNLASDFIKQYSVRQVYRKGEPGADNTRKAITFAAASGPLSSPSSDSLQRLVALMEGKDFTIGHTSTEDVRDMLRKAASLVCSSEKDQGTLIRHLVGMPFAVFTKEAIKVGMLLWTGVIGEKPELATRMLAEIARNFELTVEKKMGLFAEDFAISDAFDVKMEYAPSDKDQHNTEQQTAIDLLSPHIRLIQMLSSHYHANRHGNPHIQKMFLRLIHISLNGLKTATGHPLAREARFQLVLLGLQILKYSTGLTERQQYSLKELIISAGLSWFKFAPRWSFGGNRLQVKAEAHLLQDIATFLNTVAPIGAQSRSMVIKQDLLLLLLENEQNRLATWLYPLDHSRKHHIVPTYSARPSTDNTICALLPAAWQEDPAIAIQLLNRFQSERLKGEVKRLICTFPEKCFHIPDASGILLGDRLTGDISFQLRYLLYWAPANPVTAATYFLPAYNSDPFILQYAMRSLESYPIDITFFFVPQIVQTLRYDILGYVERFILETAKFSQIFAHQIIWNMKANMFKDEESQIPDPVKPKLDHVMNRLIASFSGADKSFYEREFAFFGEVTSISGKLKPFIKKTKQEKNVKIAEELAKIVVDPGVYLPSNPDSVVIDIDRQSGKSLQSHAKAPFMATFKIRRKQPEAAAENEVALDRHGRRKESTSTVTKEMMQAAIFKVGDDCRQDMLALQMISAFRNIFNSVGLDVFVFPYRVTATAPGCGVIDVLPKSISRDMLGRDYEMGLYDYFINKYGGEDSIKFQEARSCFVKSMAAYSVISYLLKFKDRHNGNIMLDDQGHIIHIDFGFCFDIAPGGITFERAPFKLTAEMVSVMGGTTDSQPYLWFEELCVKAFLVCRQYVDKLTHCVVLMLDSGLPCFKPETIQNFRDRFVLDKTDREAADYMRYLVKKSYSSYSTGQYDRFQHLTNGIPY